MSTRALGSRQSRACKPARHSQVVAFPHRRTPSIRNVHSNCNLTKASIEPHPRVKVYAGTSRRATIHRAQLRNSSAPLCRHFRGESATRTIPILCCIFCVNSGGDTTTAIPLYQTRTVYTTKARPRASTSHPSPVSPHIDHDPHSTITTTLSPTTFPNPSPPRTPPHTIRPLHHHLLLTRQTRRGPSQPLTPPLPILSLGRSRRIQRRMLVITRTVPHHRRCQLSIRRYYFANEGQTDLAVRGRSGQVLRWLS